MLRARLLAALTVASTVALGACSGGDEAETPDTETPDAEPGDAGVDAGSPVGAVDASTGAHRDAAPPGVDGSVSGASDAAALDAKSPIVPADGSPPDAAAGDASEGGAGDGLDPAYFDPGLNADSVFPHANPDFTIIDKAALDALIADATQQQSDALVIAENDVIITEKYFGKGARAASVQSVTKSVTSLAIGALIEDGKIASVDVPVSAFYPEWGSGTKSGVTLRHLLTMTSGLVDDDAFFDHPDLLAFARAQPLQAAPGAAYSYSNESVMLFAGIAEQAAGMPIDRYVQERYFGPLGITDWTWAPDGAGNIQTQGGLYLSPRDLLRIGTLGLHGGQWQGASLIDAAWLGFSTKNETPLELCYGYLWWVVRDGCNGVDFGTGVAGSVVHGYFADGWGGNYVAVIPAMHLVAVRTSIPVPETVAQAELTDDPRFTADVTALQIGTTP